MRRGGGHRLVYLRIHLLVYLIAHYRDRNCSIVSQWFGTIIDYCPLRDDFELTMTIQPANIISTWIHVIQYYLIRSHTEQTPARMNNNSQTWTSSHPTCTQHPIERYPIFRYNMEYAILLFAPIGHWLALKTALHSRKPVNHQHWCDSSQRL